MVLVPTSGPRANVPSSGGSLALPWILLPDSIIPPDRPDRAGHTSGGSVGLKNAAVLRTGSSPSQAHFSSKCVHQSLTRRECYRLDRSCSYGTCTFALQVRVRRTSSVDWSINMETE